MYRLTVIFLASLLVASCNEDREVARKRNEQKLPPGCRIIDLDYGDLTAAVVCEGKKTTTSATSQTFTTMVMMCDPKGICTQYPIITKTISLVAEIEQ